MWQNSNLIVYHGCDNVSADNILKNGVDLTKGKPLADFGKGFYTTTNIHQAKNWANAKIRRLRQSRPRLLATVIRFELDRNLLAERCLLCFVTEGVKRIIRLLGILFNSVEQSAGFINCR
jgi:hypothetical protein